VGLVPSPASGGAALGSWLLLIGAEENPPIGEVPTSVDELPGGPRAPDFGGDLRPGCWGACSYGELLAGRVALSGVGAVGGGRRGRPGVDSASRYLLDLVLGVIALFVVGPSKVDRERVVAMSAGLFHAIVEVVRWHRSQHRSVPIGPQLRPVRAEAGHWLWWVLKPVFSWGGGE
jgi:hypothetical protein